MKLSLRKWRPRLAGLAPALPAAFRATKVLASKEGAADGVAEFGHKRSAGWVPRHIQKLFESGLNGNKQSFVWRVPWFHAHIHILQ